MSWNYYDDRFFKPSQPIKVAGGIKAQSRRGSFGTTWWGKKWMETLEGFDAGARLTRGKSYARSGQVLSIDIEKGQIEARVQGSTSKPYRINIELEAHRLNEWKGVARTLQEQPYYVARLLAGEMPPDIEIVFAMAGLSLFPSRGSDLITDCSCPDWSNPCKHIAAVYYLLAEEFDRDPFLLFLLRGMTRGELLTEILGAPETPPATNKETAFPPEPLEANDRFWKGSPLPEDSWGPVRIPPTPAALPRQLGAFPFWRGEEGFTEALKPIYQLASSDGLALFEGTDP